jgi:hypothetical protein
MSGNKRNAGFAKAKQSLPADNDDIDLVDRDLSNSKPLNSKTADELRNAKRGEKTSGIDLSLLARELKQQNINERGNYSQSFKEWYKRESLDKLLGDYSKFSKLATTGAMIEYIRSSPDANALEGALPQSAGGLYEAARIYDYDPKLFYACFDFTPRRNRPVQTLDNCEKGKGTVLNEYATEASIRNWFNEWKDPKVIKENTDKRTEKLLTIYGSSDLYSFDEETGQKTGDLDLDKVEALIGEIKALLSDSDLVFKHDADFDSIKAKYDAKKEKAKKDDKQYTIKKSSKKSVKK